MPTLVGTDVITSLSRRYVMPRVVDNFYRSSPVFFRLNRARHVIPGGTQLEIPAMYKGLVGGGPYSGYGTISTSPSDTVKNLGWDWRQHEVPVVVSRLDLIRANSPDAIVNLLDFNFAQAEMEIADNLSIGLWSDGSDPEEIDGLETAVDDTTVAANYGGLARSSNSWLNSQVDSSTSTLSLDSLQSMHGSVKEGGRSASLIVSRQEQYDRYWSLLADNKRFPTTGARDEALYAEGGFDNLLLNGTPWCVDPNVFDGPDASNSSIVFLNEDYIYFAVSPMADFYVQEFIQPANMDAYVSHLFWAGNLMVSNTQRQGKMTNVSG